MHKRHAYLFEYMKFIKNTDIAKIEIQDDLIVFTSRTHRVKMIVNIDDKRTTPIEILNFGAFEKNDFQMLVQLVDKGDIFFDIGANIGWVSISVLKAIKDIQVFAFEPVENTYQILKENIHINHASNIKTYNFGFADQEKKLTFYYNPKDSGSASLANLSMSKDVQNIKCAFKKLDNFVMDTKTEINFIKCDVEGAEIFVFKGGLQTIARDKPVIFVEMLRKWAAKFNYSPNGTIALLKKLGYNCYIAVDETLVQFKKMDENTVQTNFFFLHPKKHSKKISQFRK